VNDAGISLFALSDVQRMYIMPVVFADVMFFRLPPNRPTMLSPQEAKCTSKCLCESQRLQNLSHRLWDALRIKWTLHTVCFIDIQYGHSNWIHH